MLRWWWLGVGSTSTSVPKRFHGERGWRGDRGLEKREAEHYVCKSATQTKHRHSNAHTNALTHLWKPRPFQSAPKTPPATHSHEPPPQPTPSPLARQTFSQILIQRRQLNDDEFWIRISLYAALNYSVIKLGQKRGEEDVIKPSVYAQKKNWSFKQYDMITIS